MPLSAIADIVRQTVDQMLPSIIETVRMAVEATSAKQMDESRGVIDRDKALNLMAQEKLEQYSRRENVRILGIKERDNETEEHLMEVVEDIASCIDAPLEAPISAIHRLGRKGEKTRPVIVRFAVRRDRDRLMKNKKKLRHNKKLKGHSTLEEKVILMEDLTSARRRILKSVQEHRDTEFAYVRDGIIILKQKRGQFNHINNTDDLFQLGYSHCDYQDIYGME